MAARRERGEVEVEGGTWVGGIWAVGLGRGVGFAVCGLCGIWMAGGKFLYKDFLSQNIEVIFVFYFKSNFFKKKLFYFILLLTLN